MEILRPAVAGTLESSDCQVTVEEGEGKIELTLNSAVINQYGNQIKKVVYETLEHLGVDNVRISIVDKGALDCTIKARIEELFIVPLDRLNIYHGEVPSDNESE